MPNNIAFANLRAEMGRNDISIQQIAEGIGMNRDTLGRKLSRKSSLSLQDAFKIAEMFPCSNDIAYLFAECQDAN